MSEQGKTRSAIDTQGYWDKWTPRPSDIQWIQKLIATLRQDGSWGTTEGTYKIDHANKQLSLISGSRGQIYWRTAKVLGKIGWTMLDKTGAGCTVAWAGSRTTKSNH